MRKTVKDQHVIQGEAHKPEPDEAAESARTRLFSDRVPGQRELETTEVQLAHSLPASRKKQSAGGICPKCGFRSPRKDTFEHHFIKCCCK